MNDDSDDEQLDVGIQRVKTALEFRQLKTDSVLKRFANKVQSVDSNNGSTATIKQTNIFISYCWQCRKEAIHEMAKFLMQQSDFKVWIDMEDMSGHTYESMAKGIDEADVVIVFFSKEYADSPNCRREVEYAANKNKELLPIRVEKGYRPDGWLLFIFKSQLRFDYCDGDNFHETASKICDYLRATKPSTTQINRNVANISVVNFRCTGAPFFSKSKYFSRQEDESRILKQIKKVAECPEDGCLIVSGDGGVGKTTLMARIFVDESNYAFFVSECNFHRAVWVNCFDWRESFDEKAFVEKIVSLAKELEDNDRSAAFNNLHGISSYYKKKNLRVAFILDDMFSFRLIQFFMEKQSEPPICFVVTRDAQTIIEANFAMVQKVERVDELTDEGIKDMLKNTFKLGRFLNDQQLYALAIRCCGLPLIASLMAARISNCDDKLEAKGEYKALISPQNKISDLKTQNRSFKTVSQLFTFSLDQMDSSLRYLYYAFLLFNPAEPISIFDLGVLWGFDLEDDSRCGLRGVCRAFEKRSLLRRVKRQIIEEDDEERKQDLVFDLFDDESEDRFLVHQMLYEAALEKAKKDFKLSGSDEDCLSLLRLMLVNGEINQENNGGVLIRAVKFQRRLLLDRIIQRLSATNLAKLCATSCDQSNGMPFLLFLYHHEWCRQSTAPPANSSVEVLIDVHMSFRMITKIFTKLLQTGDKQLMSQVLTAKDANDCYRSLLTDIWDDSDNEDYIIDRLSLMTSTLPWANEYDEAKWERNVFRSDSTHPLVVSAYLNKIDDEFKEGLESCTDEDVLSEVLITAARRGHFEMTKMVVDRYPGTVAATDDKEQTAISLASKNGHFEVVKYLFDKWPDGIDHQDCVGFRAIHAAARNGHFDCLQFLFEQDPESAMAVDNDGRTPVMLASVDGHLDILDFLAKKCPECLTVRDHANDSPEFAAATNGQLETVKYLYDRYERADHQKALMMATAAGKVDIVKYLIERDPELGKLVDPDTEIPAFIMAVGVGNLEVIEALYDASDPNFVNADDGMTAFMMAAAGGHLAIIQFMYFKNPELAKATNRDGDNALAIAVKAGNRDVVQFLQENN